MKIHIDGLDVLFPYPRVYNQQVQYMTKLKATLDHSFHTILEMPTGTGKTVCLLSLILSYLACRQSPKRLVYCTRTVGQMQKTLEQLRKLIQYRKSQDCKKQFLAVGLSARKNLCVHPNSPQWRKSERVDAQCRRLTASWHRQQYLDKPQQRQQLCSYYEGLQKKVVQHKEGVFSLQDLSKIGKEQGVCPYFMARRLIGTANIIVFNYLYLLDPVISQSFIKNLSQESVVVFDEAHNIDDVCIECYTVKINKKLLINAKKQLDIISEKAQRMQAFAKQAFQAQYNKMLQQLRKTHNMDKISKPDVKPLKTKEMTRVIKEIIDYLRVFLMDKADKMVDLPSFLEDLSAKKGIDQIFLRKVSAKVRFLMDQIKEVGDQYTAIKKISFFAFLAGWFSKGFKIILQPNPYDGSVSDPLMTMACLDSSLAMQPVFKHFKWAVLTSGTMSPIELYPKLLKFEAGVQQSIDIELDRGSITPLIVSSSADQTPLTSQFKSRNEKEITRSYGGLLIELCQVVPDGIICFFPSYNYMEHVIRQWAESSVLEELQKRKYVFVQKKDTGLTALYMKEFRKACDIGRGAVFLSIARGKIAEGVDFDGHYGRCVVIMGFPVQNSQDPIIIERIKYMIQNKQVKDKNQFFEFDTMRQCAQCLGRVFRGKLDYGLMILADSRFKKHSRYSKLPKWIRAFLLESNIDISSQEGVSLASKFFRKMGGKYEISRSLYKTAEDFSEVKRSQTN